MLTDSCNIYHQNKSNFLDKVLSTEKGIELIDKIKVFKESSNNNSVSDEFKELSEELNVLIFLHDNVTTEEIEKTKIALSTLPNEVKEEMGKLLTKININPGGAAANPNDLSFSTGSKAYCSIEEIQALIMHEFTHIKHDSILYSDLSFQKKINEINAEVNKDYLKSDSLSGVNIKNIWSGKNLVSYIEEKIIEEELDEGVLFIRKVEVNYKNGNILKYDYTQYLDGKFENLYNFIKYGTENKGLKGLNMFEVEELLTEEQIPIEGFISPYSASVFKDNLGEFGKDFNLGINNIKPFYGEEITEIVEYFYRRKDYFFKLINESIDDSKLKLDEEYDKKSKYPKLRQKVRLLIEYGFLLESDFKNNDIEDYKKYFNYKFTEVQK